MNCPHCNTTLTPEELKRLWASYTGKKQTPHAGPGRPRKDIGKAKDSRT